MREDVSFGDTQYFRGTNKTRAEQAVFIVHVFHSKSLDPAKIARNEQDYRNFLSKLGAIAGITIPEVNLAVRFSVQ